MNTGLNWLAASCVLTTIMWLPYGLELITNQGLMVAMGNRENLAPVAPWAARLRRAHANAVENLVVFAPLALLGKLIGIDAKVAATAGAIYFWARLVHVLSYAGGIGPLRTLAFAAGWIATLWLGSAVLMV